MIKIFVLASLVFSFSAQAETAPQTDVCADIAQIAEGACKLTTASGNIVVNRVTPFVVDYASKIPSYAVPAYNYAHESISGLSSVKNCDANTAGYCSHGITVLGSVAVLALPTYIAFKVVAVVLGAPVAMGQAALFVVRAPFTYPLVGIATGYIAANVVNVFSDRNQTCFIR